uniref:Helicase ATP-binding domain-containing protein n=1 Tax=Rhabditophanes sp. KR3021 TaxID=114890 RepID=A0AC35U252_9BILA
MSNPLKRKASSPPLSNRQNNNEANKTDNSIKHPRLIENVVSYEEKENPEKPVAFLSKQSGTKPNALKVTEASRIVKGSMKKAPKVKKQARPRSGAVDDPFARLIEISSAAHKSLKDGGRAKPKANTQSAKIYNRTRNYIRLDYVRVGELVSLEKPVRLFGGKMTDERRNLAHSKVNRLMETMVYFTEQASEDAILETPEMIKKEYPLKHHQKIALHWLVKKEADLGSMILVHQKLNKNSLAELLDFKDRNARSRSLIPIDTTLIVVPSSLMNQWQLEIEKFVRDNFLTVYIYHGASRTDDPDELGRHDVVITSYSTVTSELADLADADELDENGEPIAKKRSNGNSKKPKKPKKLKNKGPSILSGLCFNRIVLDEAHNIRNRKTIISRACCKLSAISRICLSGTPMHNELMDMFSLFRFMRLNPLSEEAAFKEFIATRYSNEGTARLNAIVKAVLLRRTKSEKCKLTGRPIIDLPPIVYEEITLPFSPVERKIYDHMFEASRATVKSFLERNEDFVGKYEDAIGVKNPFLIMDKIEKTKGDNFQTMSFMLVLLLRLRQATNHFFLTRDAVDIDAFDQENGVTTEKKQLKSDWDSDAEESIGSESDDYSIQPKSRKPTKCGKATKFGKAGRWSDSDDEDYSIKKISSKINHWSDSEQDEPPIKPKLRKKSYWSESDEDDLSIKKEGFIMKEEASSDNDDLAIIQKDDSLLLIKEECPHDIPPIKDESCSDNDDVPTIDAASIKEENPPSHEEIFEREFKSTKIVALLEKLEKVLEDGDDKCIIVSQWTGMLALVEFQLNERGIAYYSITGKVKQRDRDVAQESFNDRSNSTRVLLLALTAGGTGLNLATASHMFLIDSSWNPQVEAQCRGRLHRFGQDRPVSIYKFAIENTIEDQIRVLQKKKLEMAKGVLEGAANFKAAKLSRQDLAFLFQV